MNRRRRTAAAVAVGFLAPAGLALAASNDLPKNLREAASLTQAEQAAVGTFVKGLVGKIAAHGKDASPAREDLCRQAEPNTLVVPSAAFLSTYLGAVDSNLPQLLADKADKGIPDRLNAAIIVARLTLATKLTQLQGKTEQLMADSSAAVSLWGVKGAAAMLPQILQLPSLRDKQKLTVAIVNAAKAHPTAGPLVQTAYDALYLPDQTPPLPPAAFAPCLDAMNDLLASRIKQYTVGVPDGPQAERLPAVFFVRGVVVQAMAANPGQQQAVVQNLLDLLALAAAHTATLPPGDKGTQIVSLMTNYAGALNVLFQQLGQASTAGAFAPVAAMRPPIQAPKAVQAVADGLTAVRALPTFKAVKVPPALQQP